MKKTLTKIILLNIFSTAFFGGLYFENGPVAGVGVIGIIYTLGYIYLIEPMKELQKLENN